MVVVLGLIAFIINIGYFVKAKINLQNAVDAAAYSGASVQARQLTNIAYLNWEMRNVFKEWMFKYYVLGNLNVDAIKNPTSGSFPKFTMQSNGIDSNSIDKYNVPSICIDFSNSGDTGICNFYRIPGLPRFEAYNVQGMTETTNATIDAIVGEKANDCARRSALNFSTATLWAYNIKPKEGESNFLIDEAPKIAFDRQGAFPAAFELAIRMRNLEYQVNKAPNTQGVCMQKDEYNSDFCGLELSQALSEGLIANERLNKAYQSAWRNLGGLAPNDLLKKTFTLKELSPTPYQSPNIRSLSNLLIPEGNTQKFYLDLKLMTLNYSTFYTAFAVDSGGKTSSGVSTEAGCEATKVGLPIPGYPLGFVKNPNVMTYYAVKGESNFIGLFNPFKFEKGIKLSAYAAAKPFGGKIGPALFNLDGDDRAQIEPISDGGKIFLSSAQTMGIRRGAGGSNNFQLGDPLPFTGFWQESENQAIGGWISGDDIRFGIPNMIYDYPGSASDTTATYLSSSPITVIKDNPNDATLRAGLFNKDSLAKFINNNINISDGITPDEIKTAILSVRAPTLYDMLNYTVPTSEAINQSNSVPSFGFVNEKNGITASINNEQNVYSMQIYAPVFSETNDTLYKSVNDVLNQFNSYINNQKPSIEKYINSMKSTAAWIYNGNISGASNQNTALAAANLIADIPISYYQNNPNDQNAKPSCKSIAGKFAYFYTGSQDLIDNSNGSCGTYANETLPEMLRTYWSNNQSELGLYYNSTYTEPTQAIRQSIYSSFRPIARTDAPNGVFKNKIRSSSSNTNMSRNYYSTKFINLTSLLSEQRFSVFSNGPTTTTQPILPTGEFRNKLSGPDAGFIQDKVKH